MNLMSCDNCAIVIDANKIKFPEDLHTMEGTIDSSKAVWNGDDYAPFIYCPHCDHQIIKPLNER